MSRPESRIELADKMFQQESTLKPLRNWVKGKLASFVDQYNRVSPEAQLHREAYVSGSIVTGRVSVSEGAKIFRAHVEGHVSIGRYTSLWGPGLHVIGRMAGVKIGSFCSIARYVSIQEDGHNLQRCTTYFLERNTLQIPERPNAHVTKGLIEIGNDVWIGAGAHVLSGVCVGHGAVIGAGSVVTRDVPPYAVVGGSPARVLRYRFSNERISELLSVAWWNWPLEKISQEREFLLS